MNENDLRVYICDKRKNGLKVLLNLAVLYFITKEIKDIKSTIEELKSKGE